MSKRTRLSVQDEHELALALERYTDPNNPEFDAVFNAQIRKLRPDWFTEESKKTDWKDVEFYDSTLPPEQIRRICYRHFRSKDSSDHPYPGVERIIYMLAGIKDGTAFPFATREWEVEGDLESEDIDWTGFKEVYYKTIERA